MIQKTILVLKEQEILIDLIVIKNIPVKIVLLLSKVYIKIFSLLMRISPCTSSEMFKCNLTMSSYTVFITFCNVFMTVTVLQINCNILKVVLNAWFLPSIAFGLINLSINLEMNFETFSVLLSNCKIDLSLELGTFGSGIIAIGSNFYMNLAVASLVAFTSPSSGSPSGLKKGVE